MSPWTSPLHPQTAPLALPLPLTPPGTPAQAGTSSLNTRDPDGELGRGRKPPFTKHQLRQALAEGFAHVNSIAQSPTTIG